MLSQAQRTYMAMERALRAGDLDAVRDAFVNDYTPLHLAVAQRDRGAMARLLAHGADPSLKTRIDFCATPRTPPSIFQSEHSCGFSRRAPTR